MKIILTIALFTIGLALSASAQPARISANDLKPLEGKTWNGSLTYLDYTSKKKTTIRSNINIVRKPSDKFTWIFDLQYPLEPGANSRDEAVLSPDGGSFDGEAVIERTKLPDGSLRFVTQKKGRDDNRDAILRHTYLISKKSFSIRKDVKIEGEQDFFERNTYTWTR
jgi:hypothetical protein